MCYRQLCSSFPCPLCLFVSLSQLDSDLRRGVGGREISHACVNSPGSISRLCLLEACVLGLLVLKANGVEISCGLSWSNECLCAAYILLFIQLCHSTFWSHGMFHEKHSIIIDHFPRAAMQL